MTKETLSKMGLTPYESSCYAALIKNGNIGGKEIARLSGVPPTSVYRNLESLKEKGLIAILQKEPMIYHAIEPSLAIKEYVERKNSEMKSVAEEAIKEIESLKKTEIVQKEEQPISVLMGKSQSYNIGIDLVKTTKKEMLIIGRGEKPGIFELSKQLKHAVKRGVDVKFITSAYQENKEIYDRLKSTGINVRSLNINITMLIMDGVESQLVSKKPSTKEERFAIHIIDKDFSNPLREYFLSLWKRATVI